MDKEAPSPTNCLSSILWEVYIGLGEGIFSNLTPLFTVLYDSMSVSSCEVNQETGRLYFGACCSTMPSHGAEPPLGLLGLEFVGKIQGLHINILLPQFLETGKSTIHHLCCRCWEI